MKEVEAEKALRHWFEGQGYSPRKGVNVDCEAWRGRRKEWIIEVKGTQANDQAHRLSFLVGLGQLFIAKSLSPKAKAALALTEPYSQLESKYADVLSRENISVFRIYSNKHVQKISLSKYQHSFRDAGQGHPNGRFACGCARYTVDGGVITSYKFDNDTRRGPFTFSEICRELGINSGEDSAARVLARHCTKRGKSA